MNELIWNFFLYFHDYLLSLRVCLDTGNNGSKDEEELLDLVISDKSINVNEIPNDAKKGLENIQFYLKTSSKKKIIYLSSYFYN